MKSEKAENDKYQTLTDHLVELRVRVMRCMYSVILAFFICWYFSDALFIWIKQPIAPFLGMQGLIFTGVLDKFMAYVKISVIGAIILSTPVIFAQIWGFIAPGLYGKERKYAISFILSGVGLFVGGFLFAYYLVYPAAFDYLLNFGTPGDKAMISIDDYLSFFLGTSLAFGVVFELPLVLVFLGIMGIITDQTLSKNRRYAIVLLAIVAAVATPQPDVISMLLMLGPLVLLYEISIILIRILKPKTAS